MEKVYTRITGSVDEDMLDKFIKLKSESNIEKEKDAKEKILCIVLTCKTNAACASSLFYYCWQKFIRYYYKQDGNRIKQNHY